MWFLLIILLLIIILLALAWVTLTQPLLPSAPINASPPVNPARLEAHVRMLAETFCPRDVGHPANLDRTAAYIRRELEQAGGQVTEQPFEVNGVTFRNVIAFFGPDTPERIVVGAHYDAEGELPAADDNASGVAGLIELAHLLQTGPLPIRVELVAYTLEEAYFRTEAMGSSVHARSLKQHGVPVRVMFALEMLGYFSHTPGSQSFPLALLKLFYPSTGNYIVVGGKLGQGGIVRRIKKVMQAASPLPVRSINAPTLVRGMDFSDHLSYWQAGYPAVIITDTGFYRNYHYHTAQDTADSLDYERMAMVVQGVYAAVLTVGG